MLFVDEAEPSDQSRDVGCMPTDESVTSTMISIDIMEQRTDDRVWEGRRRATHGLMRLEEIWSSMTKSRTKQSMNKSFWRVVPLHVFHIVMAMKTMATIHVLNEEKAYQN